MRLTEKEKASNELIKENEELHKRNIKLNKGLAEKQPKENMNTNNTKPSDKKKRKPKFFITSGRNGRNGALDPKLPENI